MKFKIKVGFYLENKGYTNADLRFPEKGNPGIGGTEFTTLATAYYLTKYYPEKVEVLLLANRTEYFPPSLNVCNADNLVEAAVKSENEGCDIFIFKSQHISHPIYEQLKKTKVKVIVRSNNYPDIYSLNKIASLSQIKAHVCVGQEQLDMLRDHRIFVKSVRIFNPFNPYNFIPQSNIAKKGNTVVFLGNIIPEKGFHYLAKAWPSVLKKRPDAKLIVIGNGKLYDQNNKLGRWGVAEESYESYIRSFLSDERGEIIDSVCFVGLLGEEKIGILQNADVGVVNPSGLTETFCSSAVEIQACGTPVISAAKGGLLDTVEHGKTGLLITNEKNLSKSIIYLLNNPVMAHNLGKNGINFVKDKFDVTLNAKQWLELFIDIMNNKLPEPQPIKQNYFYNAKFVREGMRIAKEKVPIFQSFPALIEIKPLIKDWIKNKYIALKISR